MIAQTVFPYRGCSKNCVIFSQVIDCESVFFSKTHFSERSPAPLCKKNIPLRQKTSQIPEYWLVDPVHEFAIVYSLNEHGNYIGSSPYTDENILSTGILKEFQLPMYKLF